MCASVACAKAMHASPRRRPIPHFLPEQGEEDHAAGVDDGGHRIGEDGKIGGFEHEEALDPFAIEACEVRSERWFERHDADGCGQEAQPSIRLSSKVTTAL